MKKRTVLVTMLLLSIMLTGCAKKDTVKLDAKNPVTITLWHYYNGAQKTAFDDLVDEFNETLGKEKGIIVEANNQGNVNQLIESVLASANGKVGTEPIPNIFTGYADTVYQIDRLGLAADLSPYFSQEELKTYLPSYIDEGYIGAADQLKILPTAKSTEVMMLNKTDWDVFAAATGADTAKLSTYEGITQTAKAYYEWTDARTPNLANDGKAFFGRDAMANYVIVGSRQLGHDIFSVKNGEVTFDLDADVMKKLWDNYYVPYISGYFAANGKFRSDDAKVGDLIALVGSSTTATYFPEAVVLDDERSYPIEALVLQPPVFEGGKKVAVQQGAGMAVTTGTPEQVYAASLFLKWFTEPGRNLRFSILSGYLPVKLESNTKDKVEAEIAASEGEPFSQILKQSLSASVETTTEYELYTNRAFKNGTQARGVLDHAFSDKANADRKEVVALLQSGMDLEQAVAQVNTEQNFSDWLVQLRTDLQATQKG